MSEHVFQLLGTAQQNAIIQDTLDRCTFPFVKLQPGLMASAGRDYIPVDWQDLSRYAAALEAQKAKNGHGHIHEEGDTADPVEFRERVLGLAWYSGRVTLEATLVSDPVLAAEVFLSEGAHMVDFFFMTDEHRRAIFNAFHGSEADAPEHGHGWFDVGGYRSWAGEAFMGAFVKAYSDFPVTIPFDHPPTDYAVQRIRQILTPELFPVPEKPSNDVYGTRRGKVFHDSHKGVPVEVEWPTAEAAVADGRRPCKTCKPAT
jgi:hypothetical protein